MSDLTTSKIQQLEALRPTFGDAWVDEQIAALRSLAPATTQQIEAETANDNVQVVAGNVALVLRNITIAPGGTLEIGAQPLGLSPDPEAVAQALAMYLRTLLERYQFLNLQGIGINSSQQTRIVLRAVFIDIQTDTRIEGIERLRDSWAEAPVDRRGQQGLATQLAAVLQGRLVYPELYRWLHELMTTDELTVLATTTQTAEPGFATALTDHTARERLDQLLQKIQAPRTALELIRHERALVLLGDPGSGKTTILRYVALGFAHARLYADQAEAQLDPELAWTGPLPLPILVQLRRFADELHSPPDDAGPLLKHLQHLLTNDRLVPLASHLENQLDQGSVIALLDGLDEVADDQHRAWVAQAVLLFHTRFPQSRVVLTSRIYAYREPCMLPPPFRVSTIQPLTTAAADDFVHRWYRAALLQGSDLATDEQAPVATERARQLTAALDQRPRLRDIAANPLLLTMICRIDQHHVRLPQQRAELYQACLLLLLEQWEQRRANNTQSGLAHTLGIPDTTDRLALIQPIAYELHSCGREEASHGEVQRWLLERFLDLAQDDRARAKAMISRFLDFLEGRSGLLIARDIRNRYAFPHRTFQEYLTARELADNEQLATIVVNQRHAAPWREVILLVVGHQVSSGYTRQAQSLIWALLEEGVDPKGSDGSYRSAILAGHMVEELGGGLGREGKRLKEEIVTELVTLVQQGLLSTNERVEAALLLGRLGDPRLLDPVTGNAPDGRYWCDMAPGTFWYGDDSRSKNVLQRMHLPYHFKIARFPVTNAEFAAFIAAGGYTNDAWWTPHGWRWRLPGGYSFSSEDNASPVNGPWLEHDRQFNAPTQPQVGVSWYEAVAYCHWITAQGHAQGWLPPEAEIRLPTSLEWEYAARGADSRQRYPWGDDLLTPEHANYRASGLDRPAPVGCFPKGRAAMSGAEDLVGNIVEWLATGANTASEVKPMSDCPPDEGILLTWGDWSDEEEHLYCGSRYRFNPNLRYSVQGFRVVWSRALIE